MEVKEYRVGGMRVVPGDRHTEWRIEERRYIDAVNCFSLEIPKGWKASVRGARMLRDSGAALELSSGKGPALLRITSTRNPPGGRVRDMLRTLRRKAAVGEVSWSTVDGEEAATASYTQGGEAREAVMVVDDDVRHVIRLAPRSAEGSRVLEEVAKSFRFVGRAGR